MFDQTSHFRASLSARPVDPAVARAMKAMVYRQTDEGLTEQFGLSYNTWRKVRSGLPIRASVAERVELRVRKLMEATVAESVAS
ncbi:hypothetical protein [Sphingomonas sp. DT-204]|uniref:hypothetical protein n=1 Tax=Sphingomonas sp. DT-204 TaxID=3396166 RepID=UPI003F19E0AD